MNIAIKTVVTMALLEAESHIPGVNIPLINTISAHSYAAKQHEGLPTNITLSKYMLLLLNNINIEDMKTDSIYQYIHLTTSLLAHIYQRIL